MTNADGTCDVTFPSITLTDEVAPVFDATAFVVTDVTDCGEVDGTITVNATSAEPIEYSIDGGTTWQPSNIFSSLTAGTYDVRIRNASGTCMVDAPTDAVITAPVAPVYDANAVVSTDPTDCDTDNGTITVNNTVGSSATEYSIDGGINWQSGNVFSGLAAGTYNITIRNSDSTCEVPYANNPVILDAPNAPSITDAVFTDPTDCNLADGTITVTAIGGTAPLQYSIDGGTTFVANGGTFTGLAGGTYNIVVTNADGTCDVTFPSITLTDEVAPVFDATAFVVTDVTDCGEVDGTITVNATSAEPIEYSIDGGTTWQPSNIFSGLTAGTYDVRIRNASGTCMVDAPTDAVITAPVAPVYDANAVVSTDPTDCDTDNGTITINNTAGSSATEYSIDGGINWQSGNVFGGLVAGTYNITIRNSVGGTCEVPYANNPVILTAPNAPSITDAVFTDPTDCNLADGTITVTAIGGTAPLQYSIDGGTAFVANGGTFTGLAGGTYNIVVTNADGTCDVTFPSITLTDEVAPVFDATAFVVTDVTDCGEVDGTITVNATSAEPIEYSIDGGLTWQPSNIFSGLTAGTYDVRIRNASGTCMVDAPTDAVITAPVAPVYDANAVVSTDPTDCDTDNGTITVNNTAGSSATEYSIDGGINWQSGNVFSGLAAGTYNITIRNSDSTCEVPYANNPVILTAPNAPSITDAVFTDPTDCNLADGTITVTAIGGSAPLQYSIDGGTTFVANGGTFTGLAGGTYNIVVTNADGTCDVTFPSITLTDEVAPVFDATAFVVTDVTDCGEVDGTITVNATSAEPIEYSIDGGTTWQPSNIFSGLTAGTYDVRIRNASGTCMVDAPTDAVITAPVAPVYDANAVVSTDPTDCDTDNGTITINNTAGSSATEYSIDGGINWQSGNVFSGLAAGTYNITIRNSADGTCEVPYANNPVILDAPNAPSITDAVFTDPTDCGLSDGTITITATGGIAPLEYSIDGGATFVVNGGIFTGLTGGTYAIEVRNSDKTCTVTFPSLTLTDESSPSFGTPAFTATDITDCDETDGTITVNASGTEAIEYSIDGGLNWQSSNVFGGLSAGVYELMIRNVSGSCEVGGISATIEAPVAPAYDGNGVVSTDPTDCDTDNGTIEVKNIAGSSATEYSIDGGLNWQSGNVFSGLPAGTYNITIRNDDGSCDVPYPLNPVILDAPNAPSITDATFTDPTDCNLADGTITVTAIGGTAPLQYSIDGGTTFVANGGTFTGLAGGTYNIVVTNADGTCDVTFPSITLTNEVAPVFDATAFVVTDVTDCGEVDGTITVNAASAEPIEYSIDGGTTWQPSNIFSGLTAGTYDVRIRNASGTCMVDAPTDAVITAPVAPVYDANAVVSTDPTDCDTDNGTITINNTAGSSATEYSIDGGINWQSGNVFGGLAAGTYNITIRNSVGGTCEVPYANNPVILDAPNAPSITDAVFTDPTDCGLSDGTITITATGGIAPLEYSIDGGATFVVNGGIFTGLTGGTYAIEVRNSDKTCTVTFPSLTLTDESSPSFGTPAFTATDITDCDETDGTITVNASGTEAIEYSIDGGLNWQSSNVFGGLSAGVYELMIRNVSGSCEVGGISATIESPVAPAYDGNGVISTDPTDCDTDNGTIEVKNIAGSSATEYSIDGGLNWQSGNVFSGLPAGTYNITIRNDDGSCDVPYPLNPVILDAPNAPSITDATFTDPTGCNIADGTITVTANGGSAPLQYSIDGGTTFVANGGTFTGLAGGTYNIVVTNADGTCDVTFPSITLTDEVAPVFDNPAFTVTDVTECGEADGTITINASAMESIEYSIDGGASWQSSNVFGGLSDGTYDVSIRNVSGTCEVDAPIQAVIDTPITPVYDANAVVSTDPTDCDTDNGTITVNSTVGSSATEYSIDGGINWQSGNVFTGLPAGTYNITIRNSVGGTCEVPYANNPVVLSAPTGPSIDNVVSTNPTGCTNTDGSIVISANGGIAPLQYSIDGGSTFVTNNTFNNLAAGVYDIVVTNADGTCLVTTFSQVLENTGEGTPIIEVENYEFCLSEDGAYQLDGSYIFVNGVEFSNAFNIEYISTYGTFSDANAANTEFIPFNNVSEDMFITIFITDPNNGCVGSDVLTFTPLSLPDIGLEPDSICAGESITISTSGGSTMTWSVISGDANSLSCVNCTSPTVNPSETTVYEVLVEDGGTGGNCSGTQQVEIFVYNDPIVINPIEVLSTCAGNTVPVSLELNETIISYFIEASGGTYSNDAINSNELTFDATISGALANYNIQLYGENGCMVEESFSIVQTSDPESSFIAALPSCGFSNVEFQFTGTASPGAVLTWDIQDGTLMYSSPATATAAAGELIIVQFPNVGGKIITLEVNDGGCSDQSTQSILINPGGPIATPSITDLTSCDVDNGAIDLAVTASVGAPSIYNFQWAGPNGFASATEDINNLEAGTYYVTVTDATTLCETIESFNVAAAPALELVDVLTIDDLSCISDNGSVEATVSGGTTPYTYTLTNVLNNTVVDTNNGNTTSQTFSGLGGGNYQLVITDANGCSVEQNVTIGIANSTGVEISANNITGATCTMADGSFEINISGEQGPYTYSLFQGTILVTSNATIADGTTTFSFDNLTAGDYQVMVSGASGCQSLVDVTIPTIETGFAGVLDLTATNPSSCNGTDGSLEVLGAPAGSSYVWSSTTGTDVSAIANPSGLRTGIYTVIVTNASGCTEELTGTLSAPDNAVIAIQDVTAVSCLADETASITFIVNGTGWYTYNLYGGSYAGDVTTGQPITINNLTTGDYIIEVTDQLNNCKSFAEFSIDEISTIEVVASPIMPSFCEETDGRIDLTITGGTAPYSIASTAGDAPSSAVMANGSVLNLGSETVNVDITDANGCSLNMDYTLVPLVGCADTLYITTPYDVTVDTCINDVLDLNADIYSVDVCGENLDEVDMTTGTDECINLNPNPAFTGTSELCVVHCDELGTCDTTVIFVTVENPIIPTDTVMVTVLPVDPTTECIVADFWQLPGTVTTAEVCGENLAEVNIEVGTDGCVTIDPADNFFGDETETCVVHCDEYGFCDTTIIIISVLTPLDTIEVDIPQNIEWDTCLTANEIQLNGTIVSATSCGDGGNLENINIGTDGCLSLEPIDGFIGQTELCVVHCDDNYCDTTTIIINVFSTNDAPIAVDDQETTNEDTPLTSSVLPNDSDPNGDNIMVTDLIMDPVNGTLTINPDGTYTYIPSTDFNGLDSFTYVICDDGFPVLCDTATVVITVESVNDGPIAVDDQETTPEDTPITSTVIPNDSDQDGNNISVTGISTDPENGTVTINPDGTYTYTPDPEFNGVDSFSYVLCDDGNPVLCDTATVVITIDPVADAPIAVDDNETTPEDTPVTSTVIPNDSDPDGDNIAVTGVSTNPSNGTVTIDPDGTYTYTPNPDFNGVDSFSYVLCDDDNPVLCDTATVVITIDPVNDAPIAVNDAETTQEDTPIDGTVIPNDSDPDGDNITVTGIDTNPTNGTVSINPDGTYTYTPDPEFNGVDSFSYVLCDDGNPELCDTATVVITIESVNDAPIAVNDAETTPEDTPIDGTVIPNDSDPDGDNITVTGVDTNPTNGTVTINPDGTYTYTPNPDFNGVDSFSYVLCDDGNPELCDTATVVITIDPVNDAPIAVNDAETTQEDTPIDGTVIPNDSDPDGDNITVTGIDTNPTNGIVSINPDGTYTYTPDPEFNGVDSFSYVLCDDGNPELCDTATVVITIESVNDAPIAVNDAETTPEDTPIDGTVIPNDSDPDGDNITVTGVDTNPTNGTVTINPDGTYTYTPNPGFNGVDSFSYVLCDDGNPELCDTATVVITIESVNDAPIAVNDAETTPEDTPIDGTVIPNDSDPDGDNITVTGVDTNPTNGTVSINPDGTYTYTPNPGFNGVDSFSYVLCDDGNPELCDTATVVITIESVNDAPIAVNDAETTPEDTPIDGTVIPNDSDPDGDNITVTGVDTNPTNGTVSINPDGTYTYTPNPGFNGVDSFSYVLCDDGNPELCDTATVVITIESVNDAPIAVNDAETTPNGTPVNGTVIPNDSDPDGDNISVTGISTNPTNGTVAINPDGTYIYTPNPDFSGVDSFSYVLCDDGNPELCDTATVVITVEPNPCDIPEVANIIVVEADCDLDNGSINIQLTNANIADYSFEWSPIGIGTVSADGSMLSDLPVGQYAVTISEIGMPNCMIMENAIIVSLSDTIAIDSVVVEPANCLAADGSVSIFPDTYTYQWEDGTEDNVRTGLTAGTYIVTVIDPNNSNCTDLMEVEVTSMNNLTAEADITALPTCSDSTGTVTINAMGGSGNYEFTWEDLTVSQTRNDLPSGTYVVAVEDLVTGCETEVVFGLSGSGTPGSATVTINDIITDGCNTGEIFSTVNYDLVLGAGFAEPADITITDGTFNYQNGTLTAGDYCVEVRDASGCLITTECFTVDPIDPLSVLIIINNLTCVADIDVMTLGGYGGYVYDWSDIAGSDDGEDRTGLTNGMYDLTVTDANGCEAIITGIEIEVSCVDTVFVTIPIGEGIDTCLIDNYLLDTPGATATICDSGDGLATISTTEDPICVGLGAIAGNAGDTDTLCLEVCDIDGVCQQIIIVVTITEPLCTDGFLGMADTMQIDAVDCDSIVTVCVPIPIENLLQYEFTDNAMPYANGFAGCDYDTIISYNYFTLFGQGDLGPYTVTNWDVNGIMFSGEFMTMPDLLDSMNVWDPAGNWVLNPTAQLITGGFSSNTYGDIDVEHNFTGSLSTIGFNNGLISNGTLLSFEVGIHEVIVSNVATGCMDTFVLDIVCDTLTQPDFILSDLDDVINVGDTMTICPDELGFLGDLDTIYNICVEDPAEFVEFSIDTLTNCLTYIGLEAGGPDTACIVICNTDGVCDTAQVTVTVIQPLLPPVAVDDYDSTVINTPVDIVVIDNDTIDGDVTSLTVIADPENGIAVTVDGDSIISYIPDTDFCGLDSFQYMVCNDVGCDTAWVYVTIHCDEFIVFTGVSPNGDGVNDNFVIQGIEEYDNVDLCIYNRWGNQVYRNVDGIYMNDWDGTWNGNHLPDGTYFYVLNLGDGSSTLSGYIQLRR